MTTAQGGLWTITELSAFLGYKIATVRTLLSRQPERLPPRVAALSMPRWDEGIVRDWAVQQSRPPVRVGRPRGR
jgi:hypothetical protein